MTSAQGHNSTYNLWRLHALLKPVLHGAIEVGRQGAKLDYFDDDNLFNQVIGWVSGTAAWPLRLSGKTCRDAADASWVSDAVAAGVFRLITQN